MVTLLEEQSSIQDFCKIEKQKSMYRIKAIDLVVEIANVFSCKAIESEKNLIKALADALSLEIPDPDEPDKILANPNIAKTNQGRLERILRMQSDDLNLERCLQKVFLEKSFEKDAEEGAIKALKEDVLSFLLSATVKQSVSD